MLSASAKILLIHGHRPKKGNLSASSHISFIKFDKAGVATLQVQELLLKNTLGVLHFFIISCEKVLLGTIGLRYVQFPNRKNEVKMFRPSSFFLFFFRIFLICRFLTRTAHFNCLHHEFQQVCLPSFIIAVRY